MRSPVYPDQPFARLRSARFAACLLLAACGEQAVTPEESFQCPPRHPLNPNPEILVLPMRAHCDGQVDCPGGQDEASCPGQFLCADRPLLLPESARCDGKVDCRYGSDEEECPNQMLCGEGDELYVIGAEKLCDGKVNCQVGNNDEQDCPDTFICSVPQADGPDGRSALPSDKVCDGTWDCATDERNCPGEDRFTCSNGATIDRRFLCDQIYHCGDGSDEALVVCPKQFVCTSAAWQQLPYPPRPMGNCSGCGPVFIPSEKMCDGTADCKGAEDEADLLCLLVPCSSTSPLLVARGRLCDGASDCPGATDEANCPR